MSRRNELIKKSINQGTLIYDASALAFTMGMGYGDINLAGQNARYKAFNKLKRKYGKYLGTANFPTYKSDENERVWVCWLQGLDNAPRLVKDCVASMKHYISDREIVIITAENYKDYITLPDYIIDKWQKGIITNTHFSDILRLQLLIEHGGLWIDATTYLTNELPAYITSGDFFAYHDGFFECEVINFGSWLIYSKANNTLLRETQNLLFEYWKRNTKLFQYFLLHLFFRLVTDHYKDEWQKVPYYNQMNCHIWQMELCDEFDEVRFAQLKALTPIHKLTYKVDESKLKQNSYFNLTDKLYLGD